MLNKSLILINILSVAFLLGAGIFGDTQMHNYAGGLFGMIAFIYALKAMILFFLSEAMKDDDYAYNLASKFI